MKSKDVNFFLLTSIFFLKKKIGLQGSARSAGQGDVGAATQCEAVSAE